eukprot:TRINITY_DN10974_c0_g1_i1.p1 TRINITY_DN10974_c0_g1~~TRINITY_DN10974_c0_g1_i1.p1  ORF type:complete len:725 (-),score=163.76 TRINITY_DN10974_c0_g1_i1:298-2241(-)
MTGASRELRNKGLFLRGRVASLLPGQEQTAEQMLSKVLKLDPKSLEAWNALGEVYWNLQNYEKARTCFEQAVECCGENSVSLRNLSMVLRALDGNADVKSDNYRQALEKAKAAVALDASDAQNWETLGNAYVGDVIMNAKHPEEIRKALVAYAKSSFAYEKVGKHNPSLQLNWGNAAKYIEDYDLALRCYQRAHDIGAAAAASEIQQIHELAEQISSYVERKGDLKLKQLKDLTMDLKFRPVIEGDKEGHNFRVLQDLRAGEGAGPLVARVVTIIDRLPVILICCDANGEFFALSLYTAEREKIASAVTPRKSVLHIMKPRFAQVAVTGPGGKNWSYASARVAHPGDVIVVGSGSLASAAAVAQIRSGAERVETKPSKEPCNEHSSELSMKAKAHDVSQEQWIEASDAKTRKLTAKARAAALAKSKAKSKAKKERPSAKNRASTKKAEQQTCVAEARDVQDPSEQDLDEQDPDEHDLHEQDPDEQDLDEQDFKEAPLEIKTDDTPPRRIIKISDLLPESKPILNEHAPTFVPAGLAHLDVSCGYYTDALNDMRERNTSLLLDLLVNPANTSVEQTTDSFAGDIVVREGSNYRGNNQKLNDLSNDTCESCAGSEAASTQPSEEKYSQNMSRMPERKRWSDISSDSDGD